MGKKEKDFCGETEKKIRHLSELIQDPIEKFRGRKIVIILLKCSFLPLMSNI